MKPNQWDRDAASLLQRAGVEGLPVNVEAVARHLSIRVMPFRFDNDVSGVLVQEDGQATIGYNERHAPVRQRFTIAHEIGHFVLHKNQRSLFVDHDFTVTFRNQRSSSGKDRQEREANAFAASLLMPWKQVVEAARAAKYDLFDDHAVGLIAKQFDVSRQSMSYRLARVLSETSYFM